MLLVCGANLWVSSSYKILVIVTMGQMESFFFNAPQLNFAYNNKSLISAHNFNGPAIVRKHRGITECDFCLQYGRSTRSHCVKNELLFLLISGDNACISQSLSLSITTFTISRKPFVSRFLNDFQMNVKSRHHLSFPILYSHYDINGTKIWFISSHYSFTCYSLSFSQLPGIASFILSYFFYFLLN